MQQKLSWRRDLCNFCGACVGVCPVNALFLDEGKVLIDQETCIACGFCEKTCPLGALEVLTRAI